AQCRNAERMARGLQQQPSAATRSDPTRELLPALEITATARPRRGAALQQAPRIDQPPIDGWLAQKKKGELIFLRPLGGDHALIHRPLHGGLSRRSREKAGRWIEALPRLRRHPA